jgi:hypothetical protein
MVSALACCRAMTDIDTLSPLLSRHVRGTGPTTVDEICQAIPEYARWRGSQPADERDMPLYGCLLHPLPDGRWAHALHLFEGMTLTQRVGARLAGRTDLHVTASLDPVLALAREAPLELRGGGIVRQSPTLPEVVIGPGGWLPDAEPGAYLVVRFANGQLEVSTQPDVDSSFEAARHVREVLAHQIKTDDFDVPGRQLDMTFTLARGRIEDPNLLSSAMSPLDELLYEPIDERRAEIWRDLMACRQDETISFCIEGMPEALCGELNRRAAHYGMTADQFVILTLGHLAWRTPFAEDMAPFDSWVTDYGVAPARLRLADN